MSAGDAGRLVAEARAPHHGIDDLAADPNKWKCVTCGTIDCLPPLVVRLAEALEQQATPIKDTYACQRCGRRDGLDAVLHDEDWAQVSAAAGGVNLLCLWCIDELAEQVGVQRRAVYLAFAGRYLYSDYSGVAAVVEQRNAELRQALEISEARAERLAGYIQHIPGCHALNTTWRDRSELECTCGLSAALGLAADEEVESEHE